jgi:CDP-diacylglycerol--serine O-phosphatidyltransferase
MKIIKNIPNLLTSLNLVFGFIAILMAFQPDWLRYSPYCIFIALIFDYSDGFAARSLNAFSEFGKQLDSLSDLVSFGVAPGVLVYQLLQFKLLADYNGDKALIAFLFVLPALIPVFSAIRLAKFNLDERQSMSFVGLPTPASALLIASLTMVYFSSKDIWVKDFILNKYSIILIVIIDSFLMVSEIPMFSFKIKSKLSLKNYLPQITFILISIILLITLKLYAFPLLICLYVVISILNNFFGHKTIQH